MLQRGRLAPERDSIQRLRRVSASGKFKENIPRRRAFDGITDPSRRGPGEGPRQGGRDASQSSSLRGGGDAVA